MLTPALLWDASEILFFFCIFLNICSEKTPENVSFYDALIYCVNQPVDAVLDSMDYSQGLVSVGSYYVSSLLSLSV